jgi:hypothetical protein
MMKTQNTHKNLRARGKVIFAIAVFTFYSAGCGTSPTQPRATSQSSLLVTEEPSTPLPTFSFPTPTATSPAPIETRIPPTSTFTPIPTSTWKAGWMDFINGYYGYAISLPPSAIIRKNDQIYTYLQEDLPPDWNEKDNYFDYLNMIYPPGLCVTIEDQSMFIQITAADSLGGKYSPECSSFGGLGVAHWVWSEEEVIVGNKSYLATVLGQCDSDAPDAKCRTNAYGISMGEKGSIFLFGDDPVLFEILRSYRPAPKTELYCPEPAPTRLKTGGFAYVSTDPPLSYNNVREAPGINQTLTGKIEPGRAVELLEGPVCNNSLQWWKVRVSDTTFEGWTPEGDHKKYWLVPCESKEDCGKP